MKKKFRHIITGAFVIFQCSMQTVLADTRMIKHLDILDVWKYNYNSSHWLEQGNLKQGVVMYGEENITITSLPALLNGADWIQTAYGSKNFNKDVAATFELVGDAEVYIIHSSIIASKPAWLTSYTKTNAMVENSLGKKFDVLVKRFHRGDTVSLGANGNRDMPMYIVAVKPTGVAPALPQPKGKVFDIKIADKDFMIIDRKGLVHKQKFVSIPIQSRYNKPNPTEISIFITDFF